MAAGPFGHHVSDDDAVVIWGERGVPTGGVGEVEAVHPGVAGEDHVGEEADGPGLRDTVDDLRPRCASASYEPGNPASSRHTARADPVQLGTQLLGPEMLAFLDLECGQRVYAWLAGLLAGLGE